nr:MAG TPA: hypothetical protein [Caudoviricetes sp.]
MARGYTPLYLTQSCTFLIDIKNPPNVNRGGLSPPYD